ncbi:MAG: hypothetical protein NTX82_02030 [Candidatus Parcubacteria bacterium]|nr:hypothetical protein [Candidatus Parcubacteria bacterium]
MQKIIFIWAIIALAFAPSLVWAHPGLLDQYGGHVCLTNCSYWGVDGGQMHYHAYPSAPSFLSGKITKPQTVHLFYTPNIPANEVTASQVSFTQFDINELTNNPEIDARFCENSEVFAKGLYDSLNRARVKPVCLNNESAIKNNTNIIKSSYYLEIPDVTTEINKVYHVTAYADGKKVYSDMPEISELKGKILKGATDTILYYVNRYDDPLTLRPITAEKARMIAGDNYVDQILNFDDSIIYSYKIGQPMN